VARPRRATPGWSAAGSRTTTRMSGGAARHARAVNARAMPAAVRRERPGSGQHGNAPAGFDRKPLSSRHLRKGRGRFSATVLLAHAVTGETGERIRSQRRSSTWTTAARSFCAAMPHAALRPRRRAVPPARSAFAAVPAARQRAAHARRHQACCGPRAARGMGVCSRRGWPAGGAVPPRRPHEPVTDTVAGQERCNTLIGAGFIATRRGHGPPSRTTSEAGGAHFALPYFDANDKGALDTASASSFTGCLRKPRASPQWSRGLVAAARAGCSRRPAAILDGRGENLEGAVFTLIAPPAADGARRTAAAGPALPARSRQPGPARQATSGRLRHARQRSAT
jgi:hypothetical protein